MRSQSFRSSTSTSTPKKKSWPCSSPPPARSRRRSTYFPAALRPTLSFPFACFTTLLAQTAAAFFCFAAFRRRCLVVFDPRLSATGLLTAERAFTLANAAAAAAEPPPRNSEVSIALSAAAGDCSVGAAAAVESVSIADLAFRRRAVFDLFFEVEFRERLAGGRLNASFFSRSIFLTFDLGLSHFWRQGKHDSGDPR